MLMQLVDYYLTVRRAAGFKLKDDEQYLKSFAKYAEEKDEQHIIAQTAVTWAGLSQSIPQRSTRLKAIIRFAQFCRVEDCCHELPSSYAFHSCRNRPVPYIYTDHEISLLMSQALKLKPINSFRSLMYNTLIGLLATTGLRISEALALEFKDVHKDGLMIRETKFRKDRLIPLHDSTSEALNNYIVKRQQLCTQDNHLFVSLNLNPLCRQSVYSTFHQLLDETGIKKRSNQARPRLIDFRHTFATRVLINCSCSRDRVGQNILALKTYLGHVHVGSTYWYLESTPHLMTDIANQCQEFIEEHLS